MSTSTAMKRTALLASLVLAGACASSTTPATTTSDAGADVTVPPAPSFDAGVQTMTNQFDVRTNMRQLWTEHVAWARIYLIDVIAGLPETSLTTLQLRASQEHIGDAIRPFYGDAAARQLTALLDEHILGATDFVAAAKTGDQRALAKAKAASDANADAIARFFATANPNWSVNDLIARLRAHVNLTLAEAQARLAGNWSADVFAYDAVETQILTFADFLAAGLRTQFPDKIGGSPFSSRNEALHLTMRKLWEEHVLWTRVYIVDETSKLPDTSFAADRLLRNQVDIGNAIKPFYGESAGDQLASLLHDHITGAVALVAAYESKDDTAIADAKTAWYLNGDQIGQFLAKANPNWPLADTQGNMRHHLDLTAQEVAARIALNWQWDMIFYEAVHVHIMMFSDFLADGLAKQFPVVVQ